MSIHNTMITIFVRDCNQISQSFYDSVIYDLQLHQLTCSCSHSACLSVHGYYKRTVKLSSGAIRLRVCRVKCSECGATHALLLSSMVPYSQTFLSLQQQISDLRSKISILEKQDLAAEQYNDSLRQEANMVHLYASLSLEEARKTSIKDKQSQIIRSSEHILELLNSEKV